MATKKALLIGINEYQSVSGLQGCISDVKKHKRLLKESFGFSAGNIHTLVDTEAVKTNVMRELNWLIENAKSGDILVFMVAGHGSHVLDEDGDEEDGVDEIFCLWDMDFNNPDSYLLDDEIRAYTERLPDGVALTIIFDSCHSGTATRLLLNPRARSLSTVKNLRSRYLQPPTEVLVSLQNAGTRSAFADLGGESKMNHIFFAGCKADQTSADAEIDAGPHGAFSYYFCKVAEKSPEIDQQDLIREVRTLLQQNNFAQVPQMEPSTSSGMLFGPRKAVAVESTEPKQSASKSEMLPPLPGLEGDIGREFLGLLRDLRARLGSGEVSGISRAPGKRALVYVHGICKHDSTFADGWWDTLRPHLSADLRAQLQGERHPVVWSDLVTPTRALLPDGVPLAELKKQERHERDFSQHLRDSIEDRARVVALSELPEDRDVGPPQPRVMPMDRGFIEASGLNCIDDFTKYLMRDPVRRAVQQRFFDKILPLLKNGYTVDVMSHSWGTVVAYESLRQLDEQTFAGAVSNLFTFGSALSFKMIKSQLQTTNYIRPVCARRWVNLDAKRDFVGGSLRMLGYGVDEEYLNLEAVGCALLSSNPWCPHSSYFNADNLAVNRDILPRALG